jgi:hypothetical protein
MIDSLPVPVGETAQWNLDRMFCTMETGDLVCLAVPNEPFNHEICVGIITSKEVMVRKTAELASTCGLRDFDGLPHLVFREVKWMRTARVRDLPGQKARKGNFVPIQILYKQTAPVNYYSTIGVQYQMEVVLIEFVKRDPSPAAPQYLVEPHCPTKEQGQEPVKAQDWYNFAETYRLMLL